MIRNFNLQIERSVNLEALGWPDRGTAGQDGLRCNRAYIDLRGLSWGQVQEVLDLEKRLVGILQVEGDFKHNLAQVNHELEELYEDAEEGLFGLDLGVASSVVALSAARCIPFSSCNGGVFGDHHEETYPLVSFFVRPACVPLLLDIATESRVGIYNSDDGAVVYGEILDMLSFAEHMYARQTSFNQLKFSRVDQVHATKRQPELPFSE